MKKKVFILYIIIQLSGLITINCKNDKNLVFNYFENAEIQYENKTQKENIINALNDILNLSSEELSLKKYKNLDSKDLQTDLPALIYKHFVPDKKNKNLGNNFYYEIKSEKVQKQIKKFLQKIKETD